MPTRCVAWHNDRRLLRECASHRLVTSADRTAIRTRSTEVLHAPNPLEVGRWKTRVAEAHLPKTVSNADRIRTSHRKESNRAPGDDLLVGSSGQAHALVNCDRRTFRQKS